MRLKKGALFVFIFCLATALAMAATRHNSASSDVVDATDNKDSDDNRTRIELHEPPNIRFDLYAIKRTAPDNIQTHGLFHPQSWYAPPPRPPVSSLPSPPPSAPPLPFTFVGRMIDENSVILFLSRGAHQYLVKESEILDNDYRLDKITDSNAVFTYLPLSIQQTLAFNSTAVGSAALSASAPTTTPYSK